jgi:predicted nucleic acid-binding protein
VLSELALKRPNPSVVEWVTSEPAAMSIPFGAVIEIERGIVNLANHNVSRAYMLSEWLRSLVTSDIIFLPMNFETARLYGQMTTVPALRDLWVPSALTNKPKLGQDLSIAAVAIIMDAPIATMNTKDFMKIDRFFPLPGLYNPAIDEWPIYPRSLDCRSRGFPIMTGGASRRSRVSTGHQSTGARRTP